MSFHFQLDLSLPSRFPTRTKPPFPLKGGWGDRTIKALGGGKCLKLLWKFLIQKKKKTPKRYLEGKSMKKLLFLNFLLFWSPFLWAKDLTAKEALKIMNETQRAQLPHLLRQSQQEKFLKACGDQSFKSDENLFYQYCEAFIASDLCKDVSPEKRMNCNEDLKASITHAPENVWNCMKGVGLGIKDIIVVLGKILKGIFTFITSPIESTKKGAKIASAGLGQLQNYVSTEHMRQLQIINKENPPPDSRNNKRRASAAVEEIILSNLIDNVFNFLGEKNTAFACYNDENKWKRSCQLITNIVSIVAGGAIAGKGIHSAAQWFMRPKPGTKLTPPSGTAPASNIAKSTKTPPAGSPAYLARHSEDIIAGMRYEMRGKELSKASPIHDLSNKRIKEILHDPHFQKRIADIEARNGKGYEMDLTGLGNNIYSYHLNLIKKGLRPSRHHKQRKPSWWAYEKAKARTTRPLSKLANKEAEIAGIKAARRQAARNNAQRLREDRALNKALRENRKQELIEEGNSPITASSIARQEADKRAKILSAQRKELQELDEIKFNNTKKLTPAQRSRRAELESKRAGQKQTVIFHRHKEDFREIQIARIKHASRVDPSIRLQNRANATLKQFKETQKEAAALKAEAQRTGSIRTGRGAQQAQKEADQLKVQAQLHQSMANIAKEKHKAEMTKINSLVNTLADKAQISTDDIYRIARNNIDIKEIRTASAARKLSLDEAKNLNQQKPINKLATNEFFIKNREILTQNKQINKAFDDAIDLYTKLQDRANRTLLKANEAQKRANDLAKKAAQNPSNITMAQAAQQAKREAKSLNTTAKRQQTLANKAEKKAEALERKLDRQMEEIDKTFEGKQDVVDNLDSDLRSKLWNEL